MDDEDTASTPLYSYICGHGNFDIKCDLDREAMGLDVTHHLIMVIINDNLIYNTSMDYKYIIQTIQYGLTE